MASDERNAANRGRSVAADGAAAVTAPNDDIPKLAGGAAVNLFGKVGGRSSQVVSQIVLARFLGPESFGLYALGLTVLRIASVLSRIGLDKGVIHFAMAHHGRDERQEAAAISRCFAVAGALALLFSILLYLLAPLLAEGVFGKPALTPVLAWFAIGAPLAGLLRVVTAATRITQRMRYTVLAEDIAQPLIGLLAILVALYAGFGLLGAVAATVFSYLVACAYALRAVLRLFPAVRSVGARSLTGLGPSTTEILAFAGPASFGGLSTMLMMWLDRLIVGYYRPAAEVGAYQAASQSAIVFGILLGAFATIFVPMIAKLHAEHETERLQTVFRLSTKWPLYVSAPALIVLLAWPSEFLALVFGAEYASARVAFSILVAGQVINLSTGSVGLLLTMTGRQTTWFRLSSLLLVAMVSSSLLLVPRYGIAAAAACTATSVSALYLLGLLVVRVELGISPHDRTWLKGVAAMFVALAVLATVKASEWPSPTLEMAVGAALVAAAFYGTLWAVGLDDEDRQLLGTIRGRMRGRRRATGGIGGIDGIDGIAGIDGIDGIDGIAGPKHSNRAENGDDE